jgi:hypothetical protein
MQQIDKDTAEPTALRNSEQFLLPPRLGDPAGQPRKAGFEFEFGNLPIVETARALQQSLGGELDIRSPFEVVLRDSLLGRLKIERDADLLKSVKYRRWLSSLGVEFTPGSIANEIETNIDNASRGLVPCEVITEPIPFAQLQRLDILVKTLDGLGAEGTQHSLIYAFGLHVNASIPDSSATTLRRYIQSFLLLHAWIIEYASIDITRRFFTKYIDPYPQGYIELLLDSAYNPDITRLITDYLEFNPTRNRALDMLPVFCHLDRDRVLDNINPEERKLVSGRPAFHYRLPDCKINVAGWSAAAPWNQWVYIEKLASDSALLHELIEAWRSSKTQFNLAPNTAWVMRLTTLLSQKYLAG